MIKIINRDGAEVQLGDIVEDKEGKQYSVEDIGALLAAPQKSKQVNPKYQQHLTIVRQWRTK
jgi:hypothetical protein